MYQEISNQMPSIKDVFWGLGIYLCCRGLPYSAQCPEFIPRPRKQAQKKIFKFMFNDSISYTFHKIAAL